MSIIAYNDCMNAIRTIGGSSGGSFPDRKHGNEAPKPRKNAEAPKKKQTAVDDTIKKTRAKAADLGENVDLDA